MFKEVVQFKQWHSSSEVKMFQELCDLVILEQFKNCVTGSIAINEQKTKKIVTPQAG